jgi:hypothetical protein
VTDPTRAEVEAAERRYLRTPRAIRERAALVFEHCAKGELSHFGFDESRVAHVVEHVIEVTRSVYPDFRRIPYHGRSRHFDVGGVARLRAFEERLEEQPPDARLAARFELMITSVLLDAGAGAAWGYQEAGGTRYVRSEGLAVASYHLFTSGALSSSGSELRADAEGLGNLSAEKLDRAFQVGPENPLAGGQGRALLLRRLGGVVATSSRYFGLRAPRLGNLGLFLQASAQNGRLRAAAVLDAVLEALGPIWEGRELSGGESLGDVFRHSELGLVPFHKLSQWLTYSLFEPLEASGLTIDGIDELTGLAEYRNGGLFIDGGVLVLKDPLAAQRTHSVASDLVIEWRALTIFLLDRVAVEMRETLGLSPEELPLARVLEGGTWRTGRVIALERRAGGGPPLEIESDGTVF